VPQVEQELLTLSEHPSHGGDCQFFEVMTSTLPKGTLGSVASLLAETLDLDLDRKTTTSGMSYNLRDI
jgi:hypothetical protein